MGIFKVIRNSFNNTFKKKFNIFAITMIIIISMILGLICVVAFWNPEEKMKDLPVLVVNLDEGQHGADIVDNLKNNDQVKWVFSTDDVLSDGIENTDYYFGFSIPKDFSKSIESATDGMPIQAQITYHSNMRKNFLLSQFSKNVKNSFDKEVSSSITNKYVAETFDTLYDVESGLTEASNGSSELLDGAKEVNDGAIEFKDGVDTLDSGVNELHESTTLFKEKMGEFTDGTNELPTGTSSILGGTENLYTATSAFSDGTTKLYTATSTLSDGAEKLYTATSTLSDGTDKLYTATSTLFDGTEKLYAVASIASDGASTLSASIDALLLIITEGSTIQNDKATELLTAYYQILNSPLPDSQKVENLRELYSTLILFFDGIGTSQTELISSLEKLSEGGQSLSLGVHELSANTKTLSEGIGELNTNTKTLNDGMGELNTNTKNLSDGAGELNTNTHTLNDGVGELNRNTKTLFEAMTSINEASAKIDSASKQLFEGSKSLNGGTESLLNGSNLLNDKADLLTSGTNDLKDGSLELHDALSESADEMKKNLINDSESMGDFVSAPVNFADAIYGEVPNYGSGFSPMFMSLGLWVGALMLFFIIKRENTYNIKANSFQLAFGNYITLALFAVFEALAISICALIIGLEVTSISAFLLFTIFAALTFVAIVQCLHILFGELISKALCVLAVILQIASSGGTFPVTLTNSFFEAINPYLPFSYTIDGYREILSGGNMQIVNERIISLLVFLTVSFALSVFFCKRISKTTVTTRVV